MLLTFTTQTILHQIRNEKYSTINNSITKHNNKQPESDFTIQNVSILLIYLFPAQESISFLWLVYSYYVVLSQISLTYKATVGTSHRTPIVKAQKE
jgi:hypothetical protein